MLKLLHRVRLEDNKWETKEQSGAEMEIKNNGDIFPRFSFTVYHNKGVLRENHFKKCLFCYNIKRYLIMLSVFY